MVKSRFWEFFVASLTAQIPSHLFDESLSMNFDKSSNSLNINFSFVKKNDMRLEDHYETSQLKIPRDIDLT